MTRAEFEAEFPDFAGYAYDFSDRPPDLNSHEEVARAIRRDLPVADRIEIFETLIEVSPRIVKEMDRVYTGFCAYNNSNYGSPAQAREWLEQMIAVWKTEVARLKSGGKPG